MKLPCCTKAITHNIVVAICAKLLNFTFFSARWVSVQPATTDSTLCLCTRYPLRHGGPKQFGVLKLPEICTHDQDWKLNPRPSDLESNALSTWLQSLQSIWPNVIVKPSESINLDGWADQGLIRDLGCIRGNTVVLHLVTILPVFKQVSQIYFTKSKFLAFCHLLP